jgi:outer membrane receptor protein involved in Fe transport
VNNRLRTEGFGLLDANVGLVSADDRWALTVSGKNLTNTYYFTTAGSPDAIAVGERRTWFVGARYRM